MAAEPECSHAGDNCHSSGQSAGKTCLAGMSPERFSPSQSPQAQRHSGSPDSDPPAQPAQPLAGSGTGAGRNSRRGRSSAGWGRSPTPPRSRRGGRPVRVRPHPWRGGVALRVTASRAEWPETPSPPYPCRIRRPPLLVRAAGPLPPMGGEEEPHSNGRAHQSWGTEEQERQRTAGAFCRRRILASPESRWSPRFLPL